MVFNHKKSVILICRSKYMKNVYPLFTSLWMVNLLMNLTRLRRPYLGHILRNSGNDDKDIMRQCQPLYAKGNVLLRKFHMCSMSVNIPTVHPCILRKCGGNTQSLAFIVWVLHIINVLRRLLRWPRFCSVSGLFASQIVKLSFVTWSLDLWHDLTCLQIL